MITNQTPSGEKKNNSASSSQTSSGETRGHTPTERLTHFLEDRLAAIGYELVAIEIINHREKALRVFIDKLDSATTGAIGIEDCVRATHDLDEPLEANKDIVEIFKGPYELEVSSPGVERPLRKSSDYTRFSGEFARLHTFRAPTADETQASGYSTKNPKQKNFYGVLRGYEATENGSGSVLFGVLPEDGTRETLVKGQKLKKGQKKKDDAQNAGSFKNETLIRVPHELISKANLEPQVHIPDEE